MNHKDLQTLFILDFQRDNPEARIIINRSGKERVSKKIFIPYGFPPGGSGPDLIALYPGAVTKYFEVKTLDDVMRPDQIKFANFLVSMGFEYYVVRERGAGYVVERYEI